MRDDLPRRDTESVGAAMARGAAKGAMTALAIVVVSWLYANFFN